MASNETSSIKLYRDIVLNNSKINNVNSLMKFYEDKWCIVRELDLHFPIIISNMILDYMTPCLWETGIYLNCLKSKMAGHSGCFEIVKSWTSFYSEFRSDEILPKLGDKNYEGPVCCFSCEDNDSGERDCKHTREHICEKVNSRIYQYYWDRDKSKLYLSIIRNLFGELNFYEIEVSEDDHNIIQTFIKTHFFYPN